MSGPQNMLDLKLWGSGQGADNGNNLRSMPQRSCDQTQIQQQNFQHQAMQKKVASKLQESTKTIEKSMQQHQIEVQQEPARLQDKLHTEIGKIKQWKMNLDQDIQNKQLKLNEKEKLVEKYRTEIKNLQLKVESTSMKLQEELDQRVEINKRIGNTRSICDAMKSQVTRTNVIAEKYAQINGDIDAINKRNSKELNDVKGKYVELCNRTDETFKTFSKNVETLRAQAQLDKSKAQDNEKQLQQEINDLKSIVGEKNSKLDELMGQISNLNEEITQYKLEQSDCNKILESKTAMISNLNSDNKNLIGKVDMKNIQLSKCLEMFAEIKEAHKALTSQANQFNVEFTKYSEIEYKIKEGILFHFTDTLRSISMIMNNAKSFVKNEFLNHELNMKSNTMEKNMMQVTINQIQQELKEKYLKLEKETVKSSSLCSNLQNINPKIRELKIDMMSTNEELKENLNNITQTTFKTCFDNILTIVKKYNNFYSETKNLLNGLLSALKESKNTNNSLNEANEKLKSSNEALKEEISTYQTCSAENTDLNSKNLELLRHLYKKFVEDLPDENHKLFNENFTYDEIISNMNDSINFVKVKLETDVKNTNDLQIKCADFEVKLKAAYEDSKDKENERAELDRAIDDYKKMAELNMSLKIKEIDELKSKIVNLNSEIETLKSSQIQLINRYASNMGQFNSTPLHPNQPAMQSIQSKKPAPALNSPTLCSISTINGPTVPSTPMRNDNFAKRRRLDTPTVNKKKAKKTPTTPRNQASKETKKVEPIKIQNLSSSGTEGTAQSKLKKKKNWFDSDSVFGFDE